MKTAAGSHIKLIYQGDLLDDNLLLIGKNVFWLKLQLRKRKINKFKEVFFCSFNTASEDLFLQRMKEH